jgi:small GTP-binding protein
MLNDPLQPNPYKVVILGDSRVGKTTIIARQMLGRQPPPENPTVGCHCCEIHVTVDDSDVALQVWDTAGQEMYRSLVPVYLRGARAALLVYDITDHDSFMSLGHWLDILVEHVPTRAATIVVANKFDLIAEAVVSEQLGRQFALAHDAQFFTVSAMTGEGLQGLFEAMARRLLEAADIKAIGPTGLEPAPEGSGGCGC